MWLRAQSHSQAHVLDVGIVCRIIASLILNGVEIFHLLPYKPCEFSEAPPLWMSLFPVTLSHSFTFVSPCSLFASLIHSQAQTDAQPLSHAPDCVWRGRCYAAHVRVLGLLVHFVPSNRNLKSLRPHIINTSTVL